MKFFKFMKDGGPESRVWGFWLAEIKSLFSVAFLHFKDGSREAYHSHAFNSISWVLRGKLVEHTMTDGIDPMDPVLHHCAYGACTGPANVYYPSLRPVITKRDTFHKVTSVGDTYVLTLRGPWVKTWREYIPATGKFITLTNGRQLAEG